MKEAIAKWHEKEKEKEKETGESATDPKEAKIVKLIMQIPPIEKMDSSLSNLAACELVLNTVIQL